ncbi:MAG: hypothetical protein ACI4R8_04505 [Candidatus Caccovivens sp.]
MFADIVTNIVDFFSNMANLITADILFVLALAIEALLVIFFLVKSAFSYEASLNRSLEKLNYWLFERKVVTEENIKDLNLLFKTKAPKRLCYYWQQYILFREGAPSSYLSTENLIEKPLKTSSYNSNIKNLSLFTTMWAFVSAMFMLIVYAVEANALTGSAVAMAMVVALFVSIIGLIFVVYMRARKNAVLNALYQNVSLFGRFMDNACIDLPSYIDYQILFTPQEIEKGQPVLREFLDYKARNEKEEFNRAKEENIEHETYDFSSTGVDGSIVLDRAMKESELFLKKKEKILVKISQIEAELDSRKKNFDNVQKDYQTKIQASKENVIRLRQMQEETTNRIESNYYRKQQTQEIAKQEQFEQEFEGLRAKYLLEKGEGEEEIKKLNDELDRDRTNVENIMLGQYQAFFDKFCKSAEKVVAKAFGDKIESLKAENEKDKQYITELEIKLKNIPQGQYDAETQQSENEQLSTEGSYDENGNYVYANGTFYDPQGNFHDVDGNVYSQDGKLISQAEPQETKTEEKKVVDFDNFDSFDFMTDDAVKGDIYGVAENVINEVDKDGDIEVVNNTSKNNPLDRMEDETDEAESLQESESVTEEPETEEISLDTLEENQPIEEEVVEEQPKKKAGRPKKVVTTPEPQKLAGKRGRPRKIVTQESTAQVRKVGRPKKEQTETAKTTETPKRSVGRPKKIVKTEPVQTKRGRGRPKKVDTIQEINKRLSEEEARLKAMRTSLNKELEQAVNGIDKKKVDTKQAKRDKILKEIDNLQEEAKSVISNQESDSKIAEINTKLEALLEEINKLS